jgi:hypothetical protein
MKVNELNFDYSDIISALENPFICSLTPLEYGKAIQTAVEEYITYNVNLLSEYKMLEDVSKNEILIKEYSYSNNGPGFDRLLLPQKLKVQLKLRQVDGKTSTSKSVHFENTRRHSKKNKGTASNTGLVRYSISEFDYVIVCLCHIKNGIRKKYNEWSYSLISSSELEDVNNLGFCLPHIPSALLNQNYCDNIYMLTNKLKTIT